MRISINLRTRIWDDVDLLRAKVEWMSLINTVVTGFIALTSWIYWSKIASLICAFTFTLNLLFVLSKNKWDKEQSKKELKEDDNNKTKKRTK